MSAAVREAKREARNQIKQRLKQLTPDGMAAESTLFACVSCRHARGA
jgi:hypothetical protein